MPGPFEIQVKLRPGSIALTVQRAGGSFGWRMRARLPIANGPESSRLMLVTEAVHSGHRSTSDMTASTASGAALMSTDLEKLSGITVPVLLTRDQLRTSAARAATASLRADLVSAASAVRCPIFRAARGSALP